MTDSEREAPRYFICPSGNGKGESPSPHMFRSLEDALTTVGHKYESGDAGEPPAIAPQRLEIAFIKRPEQTRVRTKKIPRYCFYYDTHLGSIEGDGTERAPWPDVTSAIAGVAKMYQTAAFDRVLATRS